MKFLLFSCLVAFVVAAPGETNEKKRDIYAVEPVGEVEDVLHDVIEEKLLHEPEILRGIDHEVIRDDILDDVFFRSLVRDMPVLDREYLEFIDRIHSGIPVVDREVEHVVDPVLGEVRFLWILDNLLSHPEWREYLRIMDTDTGFLRRNVDMMNLESFIRDHWELFEHYPFLRDITLHFPRLLH